MTMKGRFSPFLPLANVVTLILRKSPIRPFRGSLTTSVMIFQKDVCSVLCVFSIRRKKSAVFEVNQLLKTPGHISVLDFENEYEQVYQTLHTVKSHLRNPF